MKSNQGQLLKRRREGEGMILEKEEEDEEAANGADANPEEEEETEMSEELKKFIEEKAKSTITCLGTSSTLLRVRLSIHHLQQNTRLQVRRSRTLRKLSQIFKTQSEV